jgi:hypothetical protein
MLPPPSLPLPFLQHFVANLPAAAYFSFSTAVPAC